MSKAKSGGNSWWDRRERRTRAMIKETGSTRAELSAIMYAFNTSHECEPASECLCVLFSRFSTCSEALFWSLWLASSFMSFSYVCVCVCVDVSTFVSVWVQLSQIVCTEKDKLLCVDGLRRCAAYLFFSAVTDIIATDLQRQDIYDAVGRMKTASTTSLA
jgi:hypothetical protein